MFSCILGIEDDTALSIIDPVNLTIELLKKELLQTVNWLDKIIYDDSMFIKTISKIEVIRIRKLLGISNTEEE